jgi:asparagine synthase (glutamine-hydrolysing)
MCGIGGFAGRFEPALLGRMNTAMALRGPDDAGELYLEDAGVGLCHRRLSIIDLSALGHQPMWDVAQRAAIVFNGEIYNYRELRADLERRGYSFNSQSDTEVLLSLYLADGDAMLGRLNGIFAFALWDVAQKRLLVARDAFGVKPFYYAETPKGFMFASELKALLHEPSLSREIDAEAVSNYLTYLWCPHPRTMFKAVKKLPPGHALWVEAGKISKTWSFYDLPYGGHKSSLTVVQAKSEVQRLLGQAVERQMVADVPVGAFLSGGLDSSSIVHFARAHAQGGRLPCFSIEFSDNAWRNEGMAEDLPYARRVAQHLGVDLNVVTVGPAMVEQFANMVYQLDEPTADPAALNQLFISKLARDQGIKVLLSGAGGDDIFSGYRRHLALSMESYWTWFPQLGLQAMRKVSQSFIGAAASARQLSKLLAYADSSPEDRTVSYFNWLDPLTRNSLMSSGTRQALKDGTGENPLMQTLQRLPPGIEPLDKMLYLEAKHFLADHNLNYGDKMSMAAGVEVRVPFLDLDLVSFATALPTSYKQHGLTGKWILKKAMEPYLPKEVIYRPKTGFGAPVRSWLKNELRPMVSEILSDEVIRRRGLFDAAGVRHLLRRDEAGMIDGTYPILALMCIEIWCRRFIDDAP